MSTSTTVNLLIVRQRFPTRSLRPETDFEEDTDEDAEPRRFELEVHDLGHGDRQEVPATLRAPTRAARGSVAPLRRSSSDIDVVVLAHPRLIPRRFLSRSVAAPAELPPRRPLPRLGSPQPEAVVPGESRAVRQSGATLPPPLRGRAVPPPIPFARGTWPIAKQPEERFAEEVATTPFGDRRRTR